MARPILKVKNIDDASKRYTRVAKLGSKEVRFQFGIPFALQSILAEKPQAKKAVFGVLNNGDRFDGQKLVRILAKVKAGNLSGQKLATAVEKAVR